jgi:hypothetical protein
MIIFSLFRASARKKTAAAGHFYLPPLTPRRRTSRHYQYHCRVLTLWSTPLCATPYCARCKTRASRKSSEHLHTMLFNP